MKTFTLIISSFFLFGCLTAQTNLGSFRDAKSQEVFTLDLHVDSTGYFELIFSAGDGMDPTINRSFIVFDKIYNDFVSGFVKARLKYVSWKKSASENNITEFSKMMLSKRLKAVGFCSSSTFGFTDYGLEFNLEFEVTGGETYFNVESNRIYQAPSNSISCEPISFSFKSQSELEDFLNLISPARVNSLVDQYLRDSKKIQ